MDLSIAIVSWNTCKLLDECLASVIGNDVDIEYEVIVVDNQSSDGSVQMVRDKYPAVEVIENKQNVGFSRANNQAYHISKGRHFLLLNPDTVVLGRALETLVRFCDSRDEIGAVGPCVLNDDLTLQYSWAKFPTLMSEISGFMDRSVPGLSTPPTTADELRQLDPFRTGWIGGCCFMIKRSAIERIGLMDEGLFMYCEETDWCLRLHQAGMEIWVCPAAEIVHYGGKSSEQASDGGSAMLRKSKRAYFLKHHGLVQSGLVGLGLSLRSRLRKVRRYGAGF